jgi:hypothetical protein
VYLQHNKRKRTEKEPWRLKCFAIKRQRERERERERKRERKKKREKLFNLEYPRLSCICVRVPIFPYF